MVPRWKTGGRGVDIGDGVVQRREKGEVRCFLIFNLFFKK